MDKAVINKQVVKREDNDYLTPMLVNKQVVKRKEEGGPWIELSRGRRDEGPLNILPWRLTKD